MTGRASPAATGCSPLLECALCGQPGHETRLEYAPASDCYCHKACVLAALEGGARGALALARELFLTRAAPGRPAWECQRGHRMAGDNVLVIMSQGRPVRYCRRCYMDRQHAWRQTPAGKALAARRGARARQAHWQGTRCKNGHEYTAATTFTGRWGERQCRLCKQKAGRAAMQARWGRSNGPRSDP